LQSEGQVTVLAGRPAFLGACLAAALMCLSGAASAQTPEPAREPEQQPAPFLQGLTVDDIVARLRDRPFDLGMFSFKAGAATAPSAEVRRRDVVLALPVQYARVGYLQQGVRLIDAGRVAIPGGTAMFARTMRFEGSVSDAQSRAWCAVVADDRARPTGRCVVQTPTGAAVRSPEAAASAHVPIALSEPHSPSTPALVNEDPAAASAFPPMELVYTFQGWDHEAVYLERGVRVEGRITKLANVRVPRNQDGSAILFEIGGALKLRPGRTLSSANAEIIEPFETEADLRRAAEAILTLRNAIPAAKGAAVSYTRPAEQMNPGSAVFDEIFAESQMRSGAIGYYPRTAQMRKVEGMVYLACAVRSSGRIRCIVDSETPAGWGFGSTALGISQHFKLLDAARAAEPAAVRFPIRFRIPS
jgi:hypothetical protein